jgi:hypothetical protein
MKASMKTVDQVCADNGPWERAGRSTKWVRIFWMTPGYPMNAMRLAHRWQESDNHKEAVS